MSDSKLKNLSMGFSVDIINLVKYLKANHETIISNQIGRSGTSIGANLHEAQYAHGKANFQSPFLQMHVLKSDVDRILQDCKGKCKMTYHFFERW